MMKEPLCMISINISGPGGCINYEAELIKRALEMLGFPVTVHNNYPIEEQARTIGSKPMTVNEFMDAAAQRRPEILDPVTMTVNNCPWGG
jgi:hypothetical protein